MSNVYGQAVAGENIDLRAYMPQLEMLNLAN